MKICKKDQETIEKEKKEWEIAKVALHGNIEPFNTCEYYIIDQDNKQIDIWGLSIKEIACVIMTSNDFEITKYINDKQKINNFTTLKKIIDLKKYCKSSGSISLLNYVIGSLGGNKLLSKAREFVEYEKNINGKEISLEQMVDNLANFEQSKENQNF
jgi:hypothetical protein